MVVKTKAGKRYWCVTSGSDDVEDGLIGLHGVVTYVSGKRSRPANMVKRSWYYC